MTYEAALAEHHLRAVGVAATDSIGVTALFGRRAHQRRGTKAVLYLGGRIAFPALDVECHRGAGIRLGDGFSARRSAG